MHYCYHPDAFKEELLKTTKEAGANVCKDLFGSHDCEPGLSEWTTKIEYAGGIKVVYYFPEL